MTTVSAKQVKYIFALDVRTMYGKKKATMQCKLQSVRNILGTSIEAAGLNPITCERGHPGGLLPSRGGVFYVGSPALMHPTTICLTEGGHTHSP